MIKEHVFRSILIVNRKLVDQCRTCFVHADDLNLGAFTPKLDHNFISALTAVMSQKCALLTSMYTLSITSW